MPCSYPSRTSCAVPRSLVKAYRIEAQGPSGDWKIVFREANNYQRLAYASFHVRTSALRFVPEETWGDPEANVFGFEPMTKMEAKIPAEPEGLTMTELRSKAKPEDFLPPEGKIIRDSGDISRFPSA
jgi:hypothetical protein